LATVPNKAEGQDQDTLMKSVEPHWPHVGTWNRVADATGTAAAALRLQVISDAGGYSCEKRRPNDLRSIGTASLTKLVPQRVLQLDEQTACE